MVGQYLARLSERVFVDPKKQALPPDLSMGLRLPLRENNMATWVARNAKLHAKLGC